MAELMPKFTAGATIALHPPDSHISLGGVGTTTLAIEFGWKLYETEQLNFVFHIPAGPRVEMDAALAALADEQALGLVADSNTGHAARIASVMKWFHLSEHTGDWLIIFDGVDCFATWIAVKALLPLFSQGAVLVTGRLLKWPGLEVREIGPFSIEETKLFLSSRAALEPGEGPGNSTPEVGRFAEIVGCSPLQLSLAAGNMNGGKLKPSEYLEQTLKLSQNENGSHRFMPFQDLIDQSVAELEPHTRYLLRVLCCFAPDPAAIPLVIFESASNWQSIRVSLASLEARSLILYDKIYNRIGVQQAIRKTVRDQFSSEDVNELLGAAIASVDAALRKENCSGSTSSSLCCQLIPHLHALLGQVDGHALEAGAGELAAALAFWLKDCDRQIQSESIYRRALTIQERSGAGKRLIRPLRDLAIALRSWGKRAEAEELLRRSLAICEEVYGTEHVETTVELTHIAGCLRAANCLPEAEDLYRRVLFIEEKQHGGSHPKVALALHHLAGVLEIRRDYLEAEKLYRRAVAIDEVVFGEMHPRVISHFHNLAGVLLSIGEYLEAEMLFRRSLVLDHRRYGSNSPELIPALESLAFLAVRQKNYEVAEGLYRRVFDLAQKEAGEHAVEVAVAHCNLASILCLMERWVEAETLQLCAIEILGKRSRRQGCGHPYLKGTILAYATTLKGQGMDRGTVDRRVATVKTSIHGKTGFASPVRSGLAVEERRRTFALPVSRPARERL